MSLSSSAHAAHLRAESAALENTLLRLCGVRDARAEADQRLRAAQQQADDLAAQQSQLEGRLQLIQETVRAARAAYIRQFFLSCPVDILRYIFDVAVDAPDDWRTFGFSDYNHERAAMPFVLSAVCSRWRTVALGCPELWAYVGICYSTTALDRMELLLERSRPFPLDIFFDSSWWDDEASKMKPPFEQCMTALSQHAARWRTLELGIIHGKCTALLDALRGPLPALVRLSLSVVPTSGVLASQETYLPFAPRLQQLDLAFREFGVSSGYHPGFPSLRIFTCWSAPVLQVVRLLSLSQSTLRNLTTHIFDEVEVAPFPLALPELRSLCLCNVPFFVRWPQPGAIVLPRLTTISISSHLIDGELAPFLKHVAPTVIRLQLFSQVRPLNGTMLEILRHLVNVSHLEFTQPYGATCMVSKEFFGTLADAVPSIWPKLTSLRTEAGAEVHRSNDEGILRLVNTRTHGRTQQQAALQEVVLGHRGAPAWLVAEVARLLATTSTR